MERGTHWNGGGETIRYPSGPIVLLGASYLASWKLDEIGGRGVVNCGIAGHQTHEYLDRFERDVVVLRPRAVVIWGIDNDIIRAPREWIDHACDRVVRNLEDLVRLARLNGIEPILATDLPLRPPARWIEGIAAIVGAIRGKQSYQDFINRHVLHVNRRIADLAHRTNTHVLDLHPLVSGQDGMRQRPYAKDDGSHLTEEGYRVINEYVVPRLEAWLAPPVLMPVARAARA